eukprot:6490067-Alexandrium_andersonii.AAC.1
MAPGRETQKLHARTPRPIGKHIPYDRNAVHQLAVSACIGEVRDLNEAAPLAQGLGPQQTQDVVPAHGL